MFDCIDDFCNRSFPLAGISDLFGCSVKEAVRKPKESGVKVVILTGDLKKTAIAVAARVFNQHSVALSSQDVEAVEITN